MMILQPNLFPELLKKNIFITKKLMKFWANIMGKKNLMTQEKKMAKMPEGSKLIYNPSSAAPGFMIKNIICLPRVPLILQSMLHNIKKYLKKGSKTYSISISTQTVESQIANNLEKIQNKYKKMVEIGSYPFFRLGKIGVSIVLRSEKKNKVTILPQRNY